MTNVSLREKLAVGSASLAGFQGGGFDIGEKQVNLEMDDSVQMTSPPKRLFITACSF
jgi:hypothetical protein